MICRRRHFLISVKSDHRWSLFYVFFILERIIKRAIYWGADIAEDSNGSSQIHFLRICHRCHAELVCGDHYGLAAAVGLPGCLRAWLPVLLLC